jgi:nucleotide-binding universal stress UspA family protein
MAFIPPGKDGEQILKQTLFFRQALGMRVFIYNIIDKPAFFEKILKAKKSIYTKNEALKALREFVERNAGGEDLDHLTYRVKMGNPLSVIRTQSKRGGYEFIIFERNNEESGLNRSDTDKIISRSECPILTINRNCVVDEIKKIIIPVNISQATHKKLLWATYFAKKFGAKIKIVSALNLNIPTRDSLSWKNAEKLKQLLRQRGVQCEVEILQSKGKEKYHVILEYIEKENPGMVIIRTHHETNMSGTQIGKFVSEIVHGSQVPVFTVNRFLYPMPIDFEI